MSIRIGTLKSIIQGVSQQVPQERVDGQLGSQVNMISDPNSGLRRRSGCKYEHTLSNVTARSFITTVEFLGLKYAVIIDPVNGNVKLMGLLHDAFKEWTDTYFIADSKHSIKFTMARDNMFLVNTDKVPTKELTGLPLKDPAPYGYISIRSSTFSRVFSATITNSTLPTGSITVSMKTADSSANQATAEWVADELYNQLIAHPQLTVEKLGTTIGIKVNAGGTTNIQTTVGDTYMLASGTSRIDNKNNLIAQLPNMLDGYIMGIGTLGNSSYFQFNYSTKTWKEVGAYEPDYKIKDQPKYIYIDEDDDFQLEDIGLTKRLAGDSENNPDPKFIGFGITGISAYQSRLVLLNGSYVNLSASNEYNRFSRTTVTELLDDDCIEMSNASLSSAQFEYAIPYNKDLILISRDQQAVVPANSTVLTPKTAVIYPSTEVELSLAVAPVVVERSMYYAYQRGVDYFQVGEFIPNSYTDGQYYNQGLTDHIPLYATGVCQHMAVSSTNKIVACTSGGKEVLINQFLWSGDERLQMAFHKWVYPQDVLYIDFSQEYMIIIMDNGNGGFDVCTQNIQINMLSTKPAPYLDKYSYLEFGTGDTATLPTHLTGVPELVASTYSNTELRHYKRDLAVVGSTAKVLQSAGETLVLGIPYESEFSITPPFIKNQNGRVVVGSEDKLRAVTPELAYSGAFTTLTGDINGDAYDDEESTAIYWSEVDIGKSWINGIGSVMIPCRTRLSSTYVQFKTSGTYELNVRSMTYQVRPNRKYKGLYTG